MKVSSFSDALPGRPVQQKSLDTNKPLMLVTLEGLPALHPFAWHLGRKQLSLTEVFVDQTPCLLRPSGGSLHVLEAWKRYQNKAFTLRRITPVPLLPPCFEHAGFRSLRIHADTTLATSYPRFFLSSVDLTHFPHTNTASGI